MDHPAFWTSPAPLWGRFGATPGGFHNADQARPALLRFDSDEFMEQALATLAKEPRALGDFVARPETWRSPPGAAPDLIERVPLPRLVRLLGRTQTARKPVTALAPVSDCQSLAEQGQTLELPLKLYQPAHMRHYLVGAQLVCQRPGFPDRHVAGGGRESIGFVLRRMLPPVQGGPDDTRIEHAFIKNADGARWQPVTTPGLQAGEDLLPLFAMNFVDDLGQPRRLLAGSVPVGRREEYMSTRAARVGEAPDTGGQPSKIAARKEQFKFEISEPWKGLVRATVRAAARLAEQPIAPSSSQQAAATAERLLQARRHNEQMQSQSWLTLLDFADWLATHLTRVWAAVAGTGSTTLPTTGEQALYDFLANTSTAPGAALEGLSGTYASSLADALRRMRATASVRSGLEGLTVSYPDTPEAPHAWPSFFYPLAGLRLSGVTWQAIGPWLALSAQAAPDAQTEADDGDPVLPTGGDTPAVVRAAEAAAANLDRLVQLVIRALDPDAVTAAPPVPFAARLRDALASTAGDEGWFQIRCVFQRCDCGPLHAPTLSEPTQRFQLASFFDSDAPARPIRISLPLDTTPAGLRKHNKGAALVISDVLCGQIQRAKGLGLVDLVLSVLPWPFHKDLSLGGSGPCRNKSIDIGMICSLSIPIVTICALILLLIIVSLFDFIFRWLPWFIVCFPVPGLKGKK